MAASNVKFVPPGRPTLIARSICFLGGMTVAARKITGTSSTRIRVPSVRLSIRPLGSGKRSWWNRAAQTASILLSRAFPLSSVKNCGIEVPGIIRCGSRSQRRNPSGRNRFPTSARSGPGTTPSCFRLMERKSWQVMQKRIDSRPPVAIF